MTYYDDYNFPHAIPSPDPDYIVTAKSLTTGTWTRVLVDASTMAAETTILFYDKKYRVAYTLTKHHTHGHTLVKTVYDFEGKVLETQTFHKYNIELAEINYKDTFTYTDQGRLDTHIQQIGTFQPQLIAKNVYDELGQLVSKQVGGTDITTFLGLQKVDYQYNIRGWLTQINNIDDLNDANGSRDLFSFKINYDNPDLSDGETTAGLFNGNIAQTLWHSDNDDIIRKYGYAYDALNRLTNATFFKDNTLYNSFDETLSYDKNGNIMSLLRTGYVESQYVVPVIDNLTYDYAADSNLLKGVEDSTGSPIGFNDTNASLVDYTYDANGNMISDANKDITGISYNHLNLPTLINFGNGNTIRYIYNAAGVKLRKDVLENNTHTITDYLEGHQYRDGKLGFFPHTEGYVNVHYCSNCTLEAQQVPRFNYVFQYKDHLGNIRMNYGFDEAEQTVKIMEEDHYYPFGLKHMNYNMDKGKYEEEELQTLSKIAPVLPTEVMAYKYKYNGKEYQDELGLNLTTMDFRQYDNAIGRFLAIDRLSELSYGTTPYRFAFNNPNFWCDPIGLFEEGPQDLTGWVNTGSNIFWDPNVNSQDDIDRIYRGKGFVYVPNYSIVIDSDGDQRQLNGDGTVTTLLDEVFIKYRKKRASNPSLSQVVSFSTGLTGVYNDARWKGLENMSKYGNKFRHSNGKFYSQNYKGGRWHSSESIKASKVKFNSNLKFISRVSNGLVIAGAASTIYDGVSNGWENHHTADLAVTTILYGIAASNPFGWVVGGLYFVADQATQAYSGKSITENLFDD